MKKQHTLREILHLMDRHLRIAKQDKYGVIKCEEKDLFWVRTTPAMIDRTLSFVELVAMAAGERGYPVDHQGATGFLVNGVSICAFFSEAIRRIDHVPTKEETGRPWYNLVGPQRFDFVGSGKLKLEFAALAGRRAFADKVGRPVENQIGEMMEALLDLEVRSKKELEEIAKRTAASRAAEAHREEMRRIAEARRQAIAELEAEAINWVRANNFRAYVDAVEQQAAKLPEHAKVTAWIKIARAHVETIDPMGRRLAALSEAGESEKPPGD